MPKTIFTKDDIIKAAFFILEKEGLKYITARNVAKKMGGSTAPIYASFNSMEEIKEEVVKMAQERMELYLKKKYTENSIVNIGSGLIFFAKEEKKLFKSIFTDENNFKVFFIDNFKNYTSNIFNNTIKEGVFKDESYKCVLERTLGYSYGLANCITNSCFKEFTDKEIIKMVCSTFQFIYRGFLEIKKEGKLEKSCDNIFLED